MQSILWIALAHAAPPDGRVALVPIGSGSGGAIERLASNVSHSLIAGRARGALQGWVLDVNRWTTATFSDCEVSGVAPVELENGDSEVWMSCLDGRLLGLLWDGTALTPIEDDEGQRIVYEIDESLSGVWWDEVGLVLVAVSVEEGALSRVHIVDPFGGLIDAELLSGYPANLAFADFNEGLIDRNTLYVSHGGRNLSTLTLGVPNVAGQPPRLPTSIDCNDIAPNPLGGIYCVDDIGQAADYDPLVDRFLPLPLGPLNDPRAIVANPDLASGWLAVTGGNVIVWEMSETGVVSTDEPFYEGPDDADNPIVDMIAVENRLFGGGEAGHLRIVTARPWVYPADTAIDPPLAIDGDRVELTFRIDSDAAWRVLRGGDRNGDGGEELASGDAVAESLVTVELDVDGDWAEGDNPVYVLATDEQDLVGHGRADLNVDNPPTPPRLTNGSLAFADGALLLSFAGIPDEDLDRYEVYVQAKPWDGADWPEGGPDWTEPVSLEGGYPLVLRGEPGALIDARIAPLQNGVTYYVGVRAWDTGGKEGPMSEVVQGTPQETFTAAQLAGERGGGPCSTGGLGRVAAMVLLPAWVALARRSRTLLMGLVVAGLGAAAPQAHAEGDPWWRQDQTPARGNFELRYGVIDLEDEAITSVYGENNANLLQMEFGGQIHRLVEIDAGLGFFQELAFAIAEGGEASGERTMLTWFPLTLDATLRAHFVDEQPVVPFVRYGWDYVIWNERADNGDGGKDTINGAKFGSHWALGLNVLIDIFARDRANLLEARTGINDTWITFEWRRQSVDGRNTPWGSAVDDGLDFSGDAFTVGLKLDY